MPNTSQYSGFSLYFGVVLCTYPILRIFKIIFLFQIKAHQQERVKPMEGVLKDLLAAQDKDTLQLLKEAAEQVKDEYWFVVVRTRPWSLSSVPKYPRWVRTILYYTIPIHYYLRCRPDGAAIIARNKKYPCIGCQSIGCYRYCKNKEYCSIPFVMKISQTTFLLLAISVGTKAYSLAALAAFDAAQLLLMKSLGEECLKQIQDLQIAH